MNKTAKKELAKRGLREGREIVNIFGEVVTINEKGFWRKARKGEPL